MKKITILLCLFIALIFSLNAQNIPKLKGRVNDYANVISPSDENEIKQILESLERATSAQLVVLTVNNLQGYNDELFSIKTVDSWKLGQKDRDNGVLLLLAMEEKKVRIEVGYGLEPVLTDLKSAYIIRNIMTPQFKKGNISLGIKQGVSTMSGLIDNTSTITAEELKEYEKNPEKGRSSGIPINIIIFIIIFIISGLSRAGRRKSGGFLNAFLLGSILGSTGRRGGGFSSGGFGGGGGFSGGGGGFGGGGASGGW